MLKIKGYLVLLKILILFIILGQAEHSQAENAYKIGPGDVIEILVWNDQQLTKQVVVPPDCMVSYPLVGDINVKGMTVAELESEIQEKIKSYLPETPVTVSLITPNDLKIYVLGKVNKPGVFPVNLETDVMQALAMAGGLSPFANDKKILILRKEGGEQKKYIFNYSQVEKGEALDQNITLKKGDVIVVP